MSECFFSITKMISAHPINPSVTLMRAEGSVPADLTMIPWRPSKISSAVLLLFLFRLHTNNNLSVSSFRWNDRASSFPSDQRHFEGFQSEDFRVYRRYWSKLKIHILRFVFKGVAPSGRLSDTCPGMRGHSPAL